MILRAVIAMFVLSACRPPSDLPENNASSIREGGEESMAASSNEDYRLGISNDETAAQSGLWHVGMSSPNELEADSVVLCLGNKSECEANSATQFQTSRVERDSRYFYFAKDALPLKDQQIITALGKKKDGSPVSVSFKISSTKTPETPETPETPNIASECHKAPDQFVCDVEVAIARMTNEYRQKSGRSVLTFDPKMSYVSRLWSAEQARRGSISHEWFQNGRLRQEYVKEFGTQPSLSAENVAMSSSSGTAEQVARMFVNMWINSSGHRANMLGGHKSIASGVAKRGNAWYATQNFGR